VYNTVAEIPGSEKPDEVVIIGAHLDSWDLATGATDNGTGSAAVLEAARALKKSGVKPKRTIRFVLFTGEEQGLNGSKAYVAKHQDELKKISAVLVHDSGTGKVLTIGLMGNYDARETIDRVMYPLSRAKEIGLAEPTLRKEEGTDHVPFDEAGVPGFWCVQEIADYDKTHHSQADTVDRVRWDDLTEGAQVGRLCLQRSGVAGIATEKAGKAVGRPLRFAAHRRIAHFMRAVLQRVSRARVTVEDRVVAEIAAGLMILLGVSTADTGATATSMAEKIANLRIFEDDAGKMNRSLLDVKGSAVVVSQFTLYGDARGQRRPSFVAAARPEQAKLLYEEFCSALRNLNISVQTGIFQATMSVELVNEGPVTILLDSDKRF